MQVRIDLSRANIPGPKAGAVFHVGVSGAKNHAR
jgi:hypothetical protein